MYQKAEKFFSGLMCLAIGLVVAYFMWEFFELLFTGRPNT